MNTVDISVSPGSSSKGTAKAATASQIRQVVSCASTVPSFQVMAHVGAACGMAARAPPGPKLRRARSASPMGRDYDGHGIDQTKELLNVRYITTNEIAKANSFG